jgi:hypothetical protein
MQDDEKLLDRVMQASATISNPFMPWSVDVNDRNAVTLAITTGNMSLLRSLLRYSNVIANGGIDEKGQQLIYAHRVSMPISNIKSMDTGEVSIYTHGHAVKAINASRYVKAYPNLFARSHISHRFVLLYPAIYRDFLRR